MEINEERVQELIEEYKKYAQEHGFELNPNKKIVENIVRALLKKELEHGVRYCPCRVISGNKEEDAKKICPCVAHLEELEKQGYCHCRLFVKKNSV